MLNCSRKIEWIKFWMRYSRHHAQQKSVAFLFLSLYIDRSSAIIVSYGSYSFYTIFFINKIDKEWRKTNKIPFFFSFDRTTSHFICYHTKRAHLISSLTQFIFMIFFYLVLISSVKRVCHVQLTKPQFIDSQKVLWSFVYFSEWEV